MSIRKNLISDGCFAGISAIGTPTLDGTYDDSVSLDGDASLWLIQGSGVWNTPAGSITVSLAQPTSSRPTELKGQIRALTLTGANPALSAAAGTVSLVQTLPALASQYRGTHLDLSFWVHSSKLKNITVNFLYDGGTTVSQVITLRGTGWQKVAVPVIVHFSVADGSTMTVSIQLMDLALPADRLGVGGTIQITGFRLDAPLLVDDQYTDA